MSSLVRDVRQVARGWRWTHRPLPPRSAEPFHEFPEFKEFPTDWARTPVAVAARTAILRGGLAPLVRAETTVKVEGLDALDEVEGPVIFVANHSSHLDTALLLTTLPPHWQRKVTVGAAADYFFDARWRAAVTALVFNAFPVERYRSRRLRSLAPRLLANGWSLLLFPEGTRSEDGWMAPLRMGAAQLCVTQGVAAVPVVLRGTYAAMPRGRNWPMPGRPRVVVRYGAPLHPSAGESARAFNARLGQTVARLWSEEELGWYASLRAQATGELAAPAGPQAADWRRMWESTRPLARPGPAPAWRDDC